MNFQINTINAIKRVSELGLSAMELEFVHSVNIKKEKAPEVNKTAKENNVDIIVELTADDPLVDAELIDNMVKFYLENDKINLPHDLGLHVNSSDHIALNVEKSARNNILRAQQSSATG